MIKRQLYIPMIILYDNDQKSADFPNHIWVHIDNIETQKCDILLVSHHIPAHILNHINKSKSEQQMMSFGDI